MTLDEAIWKEEALAYSFGERYKRLGEPVGDLQELEVEHRQIAEWLKELKKWKALRDSINMLCDVDCEYPQYRESGTMCDACSVGTIKGYFEQIFGEEVNADDNNVT